MGEMQRKREGVSYIVHNFRHVLATANFVEEFFLQKGLQFQMDCGIILSFKFFLPVAQLDSASDSDSEGRRFESFRVGQKIDRLRLVDFFIHCEVMVYHHAPACSAKDAEQILSF